MSMFIIQIHNIMTDFLFNEFIINKFVVTVNAALILQMIATLRERTASSFALVVIGSASQLTETKKVHFIVKVKGLDIYIPPLTGKSWPAAVYNSK